MRRNFSDLPVYRFVGVLLLALLPGSFSLSAKAGQDGAPDIPPLYLNQSGFNLYQPKRFTAPSLPDGTEFIVRRLDDPAPLFRGIVQGNIGDFSDFDPGDTGPFVVEAGGARSVSFGIGPWWLERVTYQLAVDFMIDSRHYVGNWTGVRPYSFGWRDDHHFAFEIPSLVAQYLSNPSAYERMLRQIAYVDPEGNGLWGALPPYDEAAPDVVKLMHWGADVIVTQGLTHEMLKAELAAFLYAYPFVEQWIPAEAYWRVMTYAHSLWAWPEADQEYIFDGSEGHDLFAVKTKVGTTKGEFPPGFSVMPNLFMYEVAKREGLPLPERFFDAAYRQVKWMIDELDWRDPLVTKGQRMSEHATMTGMAYFLENYPGRAPEGLLEKITQWARIMVERSQNMWDFRTLGDDGNWVPTGDHPHHWNEPGNVVGFPACVLAAVQVLEDEELKESLRLLAVSHMDNAFGRNPTGRHFAYDGPREIEGVEFGWYSFHQSGNGRLQGVRFVLDGAPKADHYPYHPEVGDVSWTEGWVNFNTAYNLSLAYMAYDATDIQIYDADFTRPIEELSDETEIGIELKAPLNFDYEKVETAAVHVRSSHGDSETIALTEAGPNAMVFRGVVPVAYGDPVPGDGTLQVQPGEGATFSYGFGYFARDVHVSAGPGDRSETAAQNR